MQFILAGPVHHNALTNCAARVSPRGPSLALRAIHLVPRLLEVADLCSSNVSDTANRLRKTRKKKSSAALLFLLTQSTICTQALKRKGRSSKRKGNHGCPFLFAPAASAAAPAASAAVPAPDGAMSPSWFTAKSPPGNGEPPARFGHTAKPVPATASLSSKTPFAFPTRRAIIDT